MSYVIEGDQKERKIIEGDGLVVVRLVQPHASLVSPDQTWAQASKKDSHATAGKNEK